MPDGTESVESEPPSLEDAVEERSILLGLCYRLLGSLGDAEDAVQDTYIRWYRLDASARQDVRSPRAWLITTASRICFDLLGSARVRRELYVGEWLPEPVPDPRVWTSCLSQASIDPADRVSMDESVSMALLVVLESMTPAERVAFVLHDVFRFTFAEVGGIVGRSPVACRQLASSARKRIRDSRQITVSSEEHAAVVRSFKTAWSEGDIGGLIELLDPNVTAVTDGGGVVSAALEPLYGPEAVARFFIGAFGRQPGLHIEQQVVNGEAGLVATSKGKIVAVISVNVGSGMVDRIWAVRNPEKLAAWE
ncbi:RNA polymerase sigma-70 factor, ECF subfamily [Brevibacterium iodinum ATCC 49514]|uniref:RNA polymerase sigma-70 factor, ECF subfamily n=1 Tax=Brevibacterium iodinum ATCC 49514 TaxID=1255616 RepID=A0A2H1KKX6_9MICO|nr:RNA polymerase sigma factor SigJ [Brevibacterium iodinum]SMY00435.1 RNA polymerase sigma-70 factor, ECF subfamily [Brevibacterium iodinum ATCC 49514]SUW70195.1 RNA polymerase sigma factor SigJ [Brevibacterium iodinum]